jgi:hypothetical protein
MNTGLKGSTDSCLSITFIPEEFQDILLIFIVCSDIARLTALLLLKN